MSVKRKPYSVDSLHSKKFHFWTPNPCHFHLYSILCYTFWLPVFYGIICWNILQHYKLHHYSYKLNSIRSQTDTLRYCIECEMVRTPCYDKNGLKKGTWTPEEDKKLIDYVATYGCWNWRQLPKHAGLSRCGKSCRLRWMNYLCPNVKRGNFSQEEDKLIQEMHQLLGNSNDAYRWSTIATYLPGRTDNEIKNHWHSSLKPCLIALKPKPTFEKKIKRGNSCKEERTDEAFDNNAVLDHVTHNILESTPLHLRPKPSSLSTAVCLSTNSKSLCMEDDASSRKVAGESTGDFWTEPFLAESDEIDNCTSDDFLRPLFELGILCSPCPIDYEESIWYHGLQNEHTNEIVW